MKKTALSIEYSVPVSDGERASAAVLVENIDDLVIAIEDFQEFFSVFFHSLEEVQSGKDLLPIGHLIVRYKYKLRDKFGVCIKQLAKVLLQEKKLFSETRTIQMRDVVKEHFSEVRLIFIDLLQLMDDILDDEFIPESKRCYEEINKYFEKVLGTLRDEWIAHLDKNILAKVTLS